MTDHADRLWGMLPSVFRVRDAEGGEPLRALLGVLARQVGDVEDDIDALYDNWFIETCAPWLVPYIGDLVGNRPIHLVTRTARADVAKTISYRRRKGTLAMLEEMARDVTGWGAHAVEFFDRLAWTQQMNHPRTWSAPARGWRHPHEPVGSEARNPSSFTRVGTVNLRDRDALDRLGGPFDRVAHTVDVRPISALAGRHNIRNLGFFLWRLQAYPLAGVTPRRSSTHAHGFHLSPLGVDMPLFTRAEAETADSGLADEHGVPGAMRPAAFFLDLERYRARAAAERSGNSDLYGPERSVHVTKDGVAVPPDEIVCMNLTEWTPPPAGHIGVDVRLGRMTLPRDEATDAVELEVGYTYGFGGDLGGGPYPRRTPALASWSDPDVWQVGVSKTASLVDGRTIHGSLADAVAAWNEQPAGTRGVIAILDNGTYDEPLMGAHTIRLPERSRLLVIAAHWPETADPDGSAPSRRRPGDLAPVGLRPHLRGNVSLLGTAPPESDTPGEIVLDGLLIDGAVRVLIGHAGALRLDHCTLAPESGGLRVNATADVRRQNRSLRVALHRSICGAVTLPDTVPALRIRESVVGPVNAPGSALSMDAATVLGECVVQQLEASNSLFRDRVHAARRQVGCVRFSFTPEGSATPVRYRCQPDLALRELADALALAGPAALRQADRARVAARLAPSWTSVHHGDPGFAQLRASVPVEIRAGADNGAEMGAFNFLMQPHREANLRARLEEYLPLGLEAGLISVT